MRPGRQFCNYLILTMCDPDILDINCVRSFLGLEPVCDLVTTLLAFLQSLLIWLNVSVLSPPGLLLVNPHSIGSFSRTIGPPLERLLHVVQGLLQEIVKGVLVYSGNIFIFWEVRENRNSVLVVIISLRCIPKNVFFIHGLSIPRNMGDLGTHYYLWNPRIP